jgi:hypothetical protein
MSSQAFFTGIWEHVALESFSYGTTFGDMMPTKKKYSSSLPSNLKALALNFLTL